MPKRRIKLHGFSNLTKALSFNMIDVNVHQKNLFHTKMRLKKFALENYLVAARAELKRNPPPADGVAG